MYVICVYLVYLQAALMDMIIILRSQKPKHKKIPIDPYSFEKGKCFIPERIEDMMQPGTDKPCNR